jgi:hypothetical protein
MSARASTWLSLLFASALTVAVGLGVGGAVAAPDAPVYKEYTDASGDARAGTDITNLTVRNDASGGVSIQVVSANPVVANHAIAIYVDSDRNQSTGEDGDDYWMFGGPLVGKGFFAWNGSDYVETYPASFSVGIGGNITEFRFNKTDIGNGSGFNFVAVSISIDPPKISFWDGAPDRGYYSYDLTAPEPPPTTTTPPPAAVVKPVIGKPAVTPTAIVAGRRSTVTFPVTRSDNGQPLTTGQMICHPYVSGRQLLHAESFKAGKARLSFVVPKSAKGRQLQVKVTIKLGQQSATRAATFRVK